MGWYNSIMRGRSPKVICATPIFLWCAPPVTILLFLYVLCHLQKNVYATPTGGGQSRFYSNNYYVEQRLPVLLSRLSNKILFDHPFWFFHATALVDVFVRTNKAGKLVCASQQQYFFLYYSRSLRVDVRVWFLSMCAIIRIYLFGWCMTI